MSSNISKIHTIHKTVGEKHLDDLLLPVRFWSTFPVDTLVSYESHEICRWQWSNATDTVDHMTMTILNSCNTHSYYTEHTFFNVRVVNNFERVCNFGCFSTALPSLQKSQSPTPKHAPSGLKQIG